MTNYDLHPHPSLWRHSCACVFFACFAMLPLLLPAGAVAQTIETDTLYDGTSLELTETLLISAEDNPTLTLANGASITGNNKFVDVGWSNLEGTLNRPGTLRVLSGSTIALTNSSRITVAKNSLFQISGNRSAVSNGSGAIIKGTMRVEGGGTYQSGLNSNISVRDGGELVVSGRSTVLGTYYEFSTVTFELWKGDVLVENGARFRATDTGLWGDGGKLTITGRNSVWVNNLGRFNVGINQGKAEVVVSDGGKLDSRYITPSMPPAEYDVASNIGGYHRYHTTGGDGKVTVTGSGSLWQASSLNVGYTSKGALHVENGGRVEVTFGTNIGAEIDGRGKVEVTGEGSEMTIGDDLVLGGSSGTLTVADGGKVTVGGIVRIYNNNTINLTTGGILSTEALFVSPNGIFNNDGGQLITGEVTFEERVAGNFNIYVTGARSRAIIAPGNSAGVITIEGDFIQEAEGELEMEIGGTTAGTEYDVFGVNGLFTAGGTLRILSLGEFAPVLGDEFELLNFVSVIGEFDEIIAFDLDDGLDWDFSRLLIDGTVSVTNAIPEPATYALLLTLFACGGVWMRRCAKENNHVNQ